MFLVDLFYVVLAWLRQKEATILFLGRDEGVKTTVLGILKDERYVQHRPYQYGECQDFSIGKIKFKAFDFDLRNYRLARTDWMGYLAKVDAVVYVVDAINFLTSPDSRFEPGLLLSDRSLVNVPFLVLLENNIKTRASGHRLDSLVNDLRMAFSDIGNRPLEVFMCCIEDKMGYGDGFEWLSQYIK